MTRVRRRILVRGVVQGVGFRPFVYRTAHAYELAGSVKNLGDAGVEIHVEGSMEAVDSFSKDLQDKVPALARIDSIESTEVAPIGAKGFDILPSDVQGEGGGQLPPDVATCDACVAEILSDSRFHDYWATSCTDCGPRFTVIESLPYDRPRTSMSEFPMCVVCQGEYTDPLDRRYHAQTTACAACGPQLTFDGDSADAVGRAVRALQDGKILAVKGIGGTHIACEATRRDVVDELRRRLGRSAQPFALMMPESWLEQYVDVSPAERERLLSSHRPIVVVKKGSEEHLEGIAPGLHTVGVMLPYSGLHHLLFAELDRPLVMTSANLPGRPMLIENEEIAAQLRGIADHYLLHNRRIVARCDDSVQRYVAGRFTFLRRSRGLVPEGLERDLGGESILALGPESDLAFALYDRGWVTASQHIGNIDDLETLDFLHEAVRHLQRITKVRPPEIIVCDAHPQFLTTQWAEELATQSGARRVSVQHHVAHLLSVQLEHHLERAVGIVLDGYGYGLDGQAWGGEILVADAAVVSRAGSLGPTPLPGGDLAAKSPLRVAASLLVSAGWSAEKLLPELCRRGMTLHEAELLLSQIDRGVNAPLSTSAGRFLDAVAAWTGICRQRTYEGEPAMRLEASAIGGHPVGVPITIREEGERLTLDTAEAFAELVHLAERASVADVAATAQEFLAQGAAELGLRIARAWGISSIGLSGGVAYNDHIASRIRAIVEAGGFDFYTNELFPCGDGGVSIGQAAYAGLGYQTCEASGETRIEQ